MTAAEQEGPVASRIGRPSKVAQVEVRLGMGIEHHVAVELAKGRSTRQIAAALKIGESTLRHHLHARGYRIGSDYRLVKRPLRPGRGGGAR